MSPRKIFRVITSYLSKYPGTIQLDNVIVNYPLCYCFSPLFFPSPNFALLLISSSIFSFVSSPPLLSPSFSPPLPLPSQLVQHYGMDKNLLPSRRLFGYMGSPKSEQLAEMQRKLEVMLQTLLQKFVIPPKELFKFVKFPFTVSV